MAERVILHTGLMKTGTSYVQRRLQKNRRALREQGVLFPTPWRQQVLAVSEAMGRRRTFMGEVVGTWEAMTDLIAEFDGTAVLSMEFLGPGRPEKVRALVESLVATGAEVRVVMTLRDLGRGVPAMWQESLKNGGHVPWDTYVDGLEVGEARHARAFWRQQGAFRIVRTWAKVVGHEHLTLVTVPLPGGESSLLWQRFCEATCIDGDGFEPIEPVNQSLGAASAQVLRDLNERIAADDVDWMDYNRVVKMGIAKKLLPLRRDQEHPIGYEPPEWLLRRSDEMTTKLHAMGLRVIGDLGELRPVTVTGIDPARVSLDERQEAARWLLGEVTCAALVRAADDRTAGRAQPTTTAEMV